MWITKVLFFLCFIQVIKAKIRIKSQRATFIPRSSLEGQEEFKLLKNDLNSEVHLRHQCPSICRKEGLVNCSIFCIMDLSCYSLSSSVLFFPLENSKQNSPDDLECYLQVEINKNYLDLTNAPFHAPAGFYTTLYLSQFSTIVDNIYFPGKGYLDFGDFETPNQKVFSLDFGQEFR